MARALKRDRQKGRREVESRTDFHPKICRLVGQWPQVGWSGRKEAGSFLSLGLLEEGERKMHVEQAPPAT